MFLWLSGKNVACSHSRGVEESMTKHKLDNPSKDCVALTKAILPSTCACGPFRLITFSSRLMLLPLCSCWAWPARGRAGKTEVKTVRHSIWPTSGNELAWVAVEGEG